MLTEAQRDLLKLAISGAKGAGRSGWTLKDLARWEQGADADGRITVRRLAESGNAFVGWPLDLLEAIDAEWGRSGSVSKALDVLERATSDESLPDGMDMPSGTNDYGGPERRSALTVAVDLKSLLLLIGLLGPLVAVITLVLQVRQDVRSNSMRATVMEARMQTLEGRVAEIEKARLVFCAGRREMRSDSTRNGIRIPDANC